MAGIAILGYGNVGKGAARVICGNKTLIERKARQPVEIKYVFDRAKFPGDVMEKYMVNDPDEIFEDPEVNVIVEALGGATAAFEYGSRALAGGKNFVTSNKELVAAHGAKLMRIARDNNRSFLFEASVGGGMPIIRPIAANLGSDNISEISGILNGTTNYILSKMELLGVSYEDALSAAQREGISESDPSEDVNGFDAARKLAILLSIITGKNVDYRDIPTEGIRGLAMEDIKYAEREGCRIKLIATGMRTESGFTARVAPLLVPAGHALSGIEGVFNAVCVHCEAAGALMFTGAGAGGLSTGAAIASDVLDSLIRPGFDNSMFWDADKYCLAEPGGLFTKKTPTGMRFFEGGSIC